MARPLEDHTPLDVRALVRWARGQQLSQHTVCWGERASVRASVLLGYPAPDKGAVGVFWSVGRRSYSVFFELRATAQPLGGRRWWALCPGCGRRCAIVAFTWASDGMGCRVCLGLGYASQRQRGFSRACAAVSSLRQRHGGPPGLLVGWAKPPRMHWSTWARLKQRELRYITAAVGAVERRW